ncbi:MAG: glycosyltransferase family 2 protein [Nostocaceae cyanobacterium]|nr:glycosyltransferase family 2 protein [Nostocaceae cyanobacterium]
MNIININQKLNKIKHVWQEQGASATLRFLYHKLNRKLNSGAEYQEWIAKNRLTQQDIASAHKQIEQWHLKPKFSVIMPVYNVEEKWLKKAIESVRKQIYPYWELCIADDASTKPHIRSILTDYSLLDSRIKVVFRTENGQISAASNSALEIATGDYIALLDHDDELTIEALFENAKLINNHPNADFIYSDEDKLNTKGKRCDPFFKPDWSPEYFHACMYTCHLGVYRTSLIREIGGFRSEYDGSQDYDLVLRVVEKTQNIYHLPKILYHWRVIPASVTSGEQAKPWAYITAKGALEDMLKRSPYPGRVEKTERAGFWRIRRDIIGQPLVSIIIPSAGTKKDQEAEPPNPRYQAEPCYQAQPGNKNIEPLAVIENSPLQGERSISYLENCICSIQELSIYRNFEIVVVDGYDISEEILEKIAAPNVRLVRCAEPFNFSGRINLGAAAAKGDFLLLLNDDTKIITPDWLESMIEFAQQKEIGAVGAKLLFPDGKIQHAGVMILNGNAGHAFYGYGGEHIGYFCSNIVNRNYIAVTGACLMMRQEVFQELGGLDEEFPLNYNDVDLCLKAHQAGYRNVVTPYVQLIHYESVSRDGGVKPSEWQLLNDKWSNFFQTFRTDPYYNPNLSVNNANFELLS